MERTQLPNQLKTEYPIITTGGTTYKIVEYFIIFLSYLFFILTFPVAIIFCLKTVTVFERLIVFRLGKIRKDGVMGPGLVFLLPCVDEYVKVDLRTRSFDVNPQEIITKDSVSIQVDAVVYYSIRNPLDSVVKISNVRVSTKLLAQATLRTVVGTKDLMELLTSKEALSKTVEQILDEATEKWGVKVERVEIKQIHLPRNMQRAMAAEQEADREAQAKLAAAHGELDASINLKAASDIMKSNPMTLQLRYLQTLNTISAENNHTVIFPFPMGVIRQIMRNFGSNIVRGNGTNEHCCDDPQCCLPDTKVNKKLQTKIENFDSGV
ncbi:band 7 protein AGAP004871-like isoform X1 [Lucilia sericata]|uniref:band 7 protein AGAP004871-like isoform X1 n=2 Tax=Lucilia sericata TaxID=13632 RepID=UPI0018A8779F|nr:band 7 protein AGAP004871-like isoform X1 [Lucilia sericata]